MKDKPNYFPQGKAAGPSRKPNKNVSIHWDYMAKRDKAPLKTIVLNVCELKLEGVCLCVWMCCSVGDAGICFSTL